MIDDLQDNRQKRQLVAMLSALARMSRPEQEHGQEYEHEDSEDRVHDDDEDKGNGKNTIGSSR